MEANHGTQKTGQEQARSRWAQVEEKIKSQIELLKSEAKFHDAPPPPDVLNTYIYQRPVSPNSEVKIYF